MRAYAAVKQSCKVGGILSVLSSSTMSVTEDALFKTITGAHVLLDGDLDFKLAQVQF